MNLTTGQLIQSTGWTMDRPDVFQEIMAHDDTRTDPPRICSFQQQITSETVQCLFPVIKHILIELTFLSCNNGLTMQSRRELSSGEREFSTKWNDKPKDNKLNQTVSRSVTSRLTSLYGLYFTFILHLPFANPPPYWGWEGRGWWRLPGYHQRRRIRCIFSDKN